MELVPTTFCHFFFVFNELLPALPVAIAVRLYGKHYRDKVDTKDSIIGNLYEL